MEIVTHRPKLLAEWRRRYRGSEKPNEAALRRQLNSIKRQQFLWMLLVPKSVPQQAIKNCGAAFQRFFKKQGRYPKFKKKGAIPQAWTTVPAHSSLTAKESVCR
jgi:transposase